MFDYFKNYSNNAHQVCCEDSPTKGLYGHCSPMTLTIHSRSQVRLKLDYFLTCNIFRHYLSYYIQTWHDSRLKQWHIIYAHAHLDDLEFDHDFENVCKACHCFLVFKMFRL